MFTFLFLYQEKNLPSDYEGGDGEGLENKIQTIPCKYHIFQMEELQTALEVPITKTLSIEMI